MIYEDVDKMVTTSMDTIDKLLEHEAWPNALVLYFKYIKEGRVRGNPIRVKDDEMMELLWRSSEKFYAAKKILKDYSMVEVVQERAWWKIKGRYIKVKFILLQPSTTTTLPTHTLVKPVSGKSEDFMYEPLDAIRERIKKILSPEEVLKYMNPLFCLVHLINAWMPLAADKKKLISQCEMIQAYYDARKFPMNNRDEMETIAQSCAVYNLWQIDGGRKTRHDINYLSSFNTFVTKRYEKKEFNNKR